MHPRAVETTEGGMGGNLGGGSGGGRIPGSKTTNRVQGGDDGVRSQGGNRRLNSGTESLSELDLETVAPSGLDVETGALLWAGRGNRSPSLGWTWKQEPFSGLNMGTAALFGLDVETGLTEGTYEGGRRGGWSAYKSLNPPLELHSL